MVYFDFCLEENSISNNSFSEEDSSPKPSVIKNLPLESSMQKRKLTDKQVVKKLEKKLSTMSKIKEENISKKDLTVEGGVYDYYTAKDNYQDEIPFDLYNMVELAKRVNKPYSIPKSDNISHQDIRNLQRKYIVFIFDVWFIGTKKTKATSILI